MKKAILYTTLSIFTCTAIFSSCRKDDNSSPSPEANAVIQGAVFAELDLSNSNIERAPFGTKIHALIDPKDVMIDPDTQMVMDKIRITTTVDGSGNFTLNLRAKNSAVPVTIIADDFIFDQKLLTAGTSARKVYTMNAVSTTIIAGQTKVNDLIFN
ncbi:MAG: hypothetical protein ACK5P4_12070 [Bacteroidota bacterium]|jgi:hypothetical protein